MLAGEVTRTGMWSKMGKGMEEGAEVDEPRRSLAYWGRCSEPQMEASTRTGKAQLWRRQTARELERGQSWRELDLENEMEKKKRFASEALQPVSRSR